VTALRRLALAVRDLPIALPLLAVALLPGLAEQGTRLGGAPSRPFDLLAVAVVAVECLPLALRRRAPGTCLALVSLAFAVDQLAGYHSAAGTAVPVALFSAGAHLGRHRRAAVLLASAAYLALVLAFGLRGQGEPVGEFLTFYLALALAWGAGSWLRGSRASEAELRRRIAADTRAAERARIARDLHDVVTHHVTAMVVQAEAARYLTAAPEPLDRALTAVTDTGRRAITDLRHLLELLDPEHGVVPRSAGLDDLVDRARDAGQPVEFVEQGAPDAVGSAGLVAYRVVQEALTNALKHAPGRPTAVHVDHGERQITVRVRTDGPAAAPAGAGGRGLAGLRERVELLGGDVTAGPDGDGFVVHARVPRS
jgi:signal transduction histidine kinase